MKQDAFKDMELIKRFIRQSSEENSVPSVLLLLSGIIPILLYFLINELLLEFIKKNITLSIIIGALLFLLIGLSEHHFLFHRKEKDFGIVKKRLMNTYFFTDIILGIGIITLCIIFYKLNNINYIGPSALFITGFYVMILSFYMDKNLIILFFLLLFLSPIILISFENTLLPSLVTWFILSLLYIILKKNNIFFTSGKIIKSDDVQLEILLHSPALSTPSSIFFLWGIIILLGYFLLSDKFLILPPAGKYLLLTCLIIIGLFFEMILFFNNIRKNKMKVSKGIIHFSVLTELSFFILIILTNLVLLHLGGRAYIVPFIAMITSSVFVIFSLSFLNNLLLFSLILYLLSLASFFLLNHAPEINAFGFGSLFILYHLLSFKKEKTAP